MTSSANPRPGERPRLSLAEALKRSAASRQDAKDAATKLYQPAKPEEVKK